jgi:hypothetical protein
VIVDAVEAVDLLLFVLDSPVEVVVAEPHLLLSASVCMRYSSEEFIVKAEGGLMRVVAPPGLKGIVEAFVL